MTAIPAPAMPVADLRCGVCGSAEWFACFPGTEAEARVQGNVCVLHPAREVAMRCRCLACWKAGR